MTAKQPPKLPPGALLDGDMVAEPVSDGWIAYHTMTGELDHQADRDALAWGRGPTAGAALVDARQRGRREIQDPDSPAYLRPLMDGTVTPLRSPVRSSAPSPPSG